MRIADTGNHLSTHREHRPAGTVNSTQNFPRARRGTPHRESRPSEAGFLASGKAGDRWGLAFVASPRRAGRTDRRRTLLRGPVLLGLLAPELEPEPPRPRFEDAVHRPRDAWLSELARGPLSRFRHEVSLRPGGEVQDPSEYLHIEQNRGDSEVSGEPLVQDRIPAIHHAHLECESTKDKRHGRRIGSLDGVDHPRGQGRVLPFRPRPENHEKREAQAEKCGHGAPCEWSEAGSYRLRPEQRAGDRCTRKHDAGSAAEALERVPAYRQSANRFREDQLVGIVHTRLSAGRHQLAPVRRPRAPRPCGPRRPSSPRACSSRAPSARARAPAPASAAGAAPACRGRALRTSPPRAAACRG